MKNAYEQLMAEGYIYGMEKKGYYVSPVQRPLTAQLPRQDAAPPAEHHWEVVLSPTPSRRRISPLPSGRG